MPSLARTIFSNDKACVLRLFQDWFGILEFPATFAATVEKFAAVSVDKQYDEPLKVVLPQS